MNRMHQNSPGTMTISAPASASAAAAAATMPTSERSSSSIRQELQQLRGDLFDISDADSSIALILTKVQQLTEFENRVVEEQRSEIDALNEELDRLRRQQHQRNGDKSGENGDGEDDGEESEIDGLQSIPSFGSITMNSSSSVSSSGGFTGFTAESERDSSYSMLTNQQLATKANLSQSIAAGSAELRDLNMSKEEARDEVRNLYEKIKEVNEELDELTESKERIMAEIAELKQQVQMLLKERTKLIQEVEIYSHQAELATELEHSQETNNKLRYEIETLREAVAMATKRVENEVAHAMDGKERALDEKRMSEEWSARAIKEANEMAATESMIRKEMQCEMQFLYEEKIAREKELEDWKNNASRVNNAVIGGKKANCSAGGGVIGRETDMTHLKSEIQALRGENASLRSTAKKDSEAIAGLNDEIRSLISSGPVANTGTPANKATRSCNASPSPDPASNTSAFPTPLTNNTTLSAAQAQAAAASRKRALVLSQGSVGEDERSREYKRSIHYEPHRLEQISGPSRERLGSAGSTSLEKIEGGASFSAGGSRERLDTGGSDSVSALHDADNVSLLFGHDSVDGIKSPKSDSKSTNSNNAEEDGTAKSDHDGIRAHAEKLLYWANKAAERSKSGSSVASRQGSQQGGGATPQNTTPIKQQYSASASPIPKTIGLPPRSQSRVRKSSQLPPRCPPTLPIASSAQHQPSVTTDCNSTVLSDKENGGSSFNREREVPGAFPKLPPRQQQRKKNVSLSENYTIIDNLVYMQENEEVLVENNEAPILCCECSASPFSGNDPQSEFYLPKLGLACNCNGNNDNVDVEGLLEDERVSFSKNPTALSNILRPWQCDFLQTLGVATADELLKAHKADANDMSRKMKKWRVSQGMVLTRSKECYVALKIWSRTCKVVLRSIREQKELARRRREAAEGRGDDEVGAGEGGAGANGEEDVIIEKPHFLDISFADTHTIASISTLGQFSSVGGGGRPFEMMEI